MQARRKRAAFAHFINLMRVEEAKDQEEYFRSMQQMSAYFNDRWERIATTFGYREPRKTVAELRDEINNPPPPKVPPSPCLQPLCYPAPPSCLTATSHHHRHRVAI